MAQVGGSWSAGHPSGENSGLPATSSQKASKAESFEGARRLGSRLGEVGEARRRALAAAGGCGWKCGWKVSLPEGPRREIGERGATNTRAGWREEGAGRLRGVGRGVRRWAGVTKGGEPKRALGSGVGS